MYVISSEERFRSAMDGAKGALKSNREHQPNPTQSPSHSNNIPLVARTDRPPIDRGIALQVQRSRAHQISLKISRRKFRIAAKRIFQLQLWRMEEAEGSEA